MSVYMIYIARSYSHRQVRLAAAVNANTVSVANAVCTMKSVEAENNRLVVMEVDCSGSEDSTRDAAFIAAYLKKPGPFTCTRYHWAYADCRLQGS